jgi:hypothetical protein
MIVIRRQVASHQLVVKTIAPVVAVIHVAAVAVRTIVVVLVLVVVHLVVLSIHHHHHHRHHHHHHVPANVVSSEKSIHNKDEVL